jgi:hypothetical protein
LVLLVSTPYEGSGGIFVRHQRTFYF